MTLSSPSKLRVPTNRTLDEIGFGVIQSLRLKEDLPLPKLGYGDRVCVIGTNLTGGKVIGFDGDHNHARIEWPSGYTGTWYIRDLRKEEPLLHAQTASLGGAKIAN
jgi:hypothetical protein